MVNIRSGGPSNPARQVRHNQHPETRLEQIQRRIRMDGFRYERITEGNRRIWSFIVADEEVENIPETFNDLARDIRDLISETLRMNQDQDFRMQVRIIPVGSTHDYSALRPNLESITGEYLSSRYQGIVKSSDVLVFQGLEIRITQLFDNGGSAQLTGKLPQHVRGVGIWQHPKTPKEPIDAPCGLIAFLLGFEVERYENDYQTLLSDAEDLAIKLGFDVMMTNDNFNKVVELPEFYDQRILIFRIKGAIEKEITGKNWEFSGSISEPDPNTVCLYRDDIPKEKHYYWLRYPKQLTFYRGDYVKCFVCYRSYSQKKFSKHHCFHVTIFNCDLCQEVFLSKDVLEEHKKKSSKGWRCGVCFKSEFNGRQCFDKHEKICSVDKKSTCEECLRSYLVNKPHGCNDFGGCRPCNTIFTCAKDRREHECFLQPETNFFASVRIIEKQNRIVWNSHWFYDFETTKGKLSYAVGSHTAYVHEVMAWCMQLIIPDDETREYLERDGVIEHMMSKLFDLKGYNDIEYDNPEEFVFWIRGKELKSFIYACENIAKNNKPVWKPTFWAHNGSKFDVKFILDYYSRFLDIHGGHAKYDNTMPDGKGGWIFEKDSSINKKGDYIKPNLIGSKVLSLKVRDMTFRCSYAHIANPLRDLPKVFGLKDVSVKKGEFPYRRLQHENWGKVFPFPSLDEFNVESMTEGRAREVEAWYSEQDKSKLWNFDEEVWSYLHNDVNVGAKCMEAYHQNAINLHKSLWEKTGETKLCSPLMYSTVASWTFAMYRTWFMREKIYILDEKKTKFVRDSLRGGRTDMRSFYAEITPEQRKAGYRIEYFDFKSLYPSVQKCNVHGTHFPTGTGKWANFVGPVTNDQLIKFMGNKTGFLNISCLPKNEGVEGYRTHPTLHQVYKVDGDDSNKLIFDLYEKQYETYGWPEILEAIRCDEIEITYVHQALLFDKTENIFNEFVDYLFDLKDYYDKPGQQNEGMRSLVKLLLNSLWGKLAQRSYPVSEWVTDESRLDYLYKKFESEEYECTSWYTKDSAGVNHVQYRIKDDINNRKSTAPHVAAFVAMWGRIILHRKLLAHHGMKALYCDTDSAILYLEPGDEVPYVGNELGDLVDELPKMIKSRKDLIDASPFINQVVVCAAKSYAIKMMSLDDLTIDPHYVVKCKGFEPSRKNSREINFNSFKELVFTQQGLNSYLNGKRDRSEEEQVPHRRFITVTRDLQFRSSLSRDELDRTCPAELNDQTKSMTASNIKGKTHREDPRFIEPFGPESICPPPGTFLDSKINGEYK